MTAERCVLEFHNGEPIEFHGKEWRHPCVEPSSSAEELERGGSSMGLTFQRQPVSSVADAHRGRSMKIALIALAGLVGVAAPAYAALCIFCG